jgi:hypothetical protein
VSDVLSQLLDTRRWVYWLDQTHPDPDEKREKGVAPKVFRVSIVFENEAGHFPTGGGASDPLKAPWYWDQETCKHANAKRGFTEEQAFDIVTSSMRATNLARR